jgi:hypothetical protein
MRARVAAGWIEPEPEPEPEPEIDDTEAELEEGLADDQALAEAAH